MRNAALVFTPFHSSCPRISRYTGDAIPLTHPHLALLSIPWGDRIAEQVWGDIFIDLPDLGFGVLTAATAGGIPREPRDTIP
jgi:hypothetical protein